MKSKLFSLIAVILFLGSCKTGNNFTSRRYMTGHYKPNHAAIKKPGSMAVKRHDNSLNKKDHTVLAEPKEAPVLIAANTEKKVVFTEKKHKHLDLSAASKKAKGVVFKKAFDFLKPLTQKRSEPLRTGKSDESISTKSLVGFACGIGGIAIDIIAFIAAVAALNYGILIAMVVGLVLGIVGIVFGTQGIKDYKSSRNTPTLVFGIIGAATGLSAIILAIYLGLYGALLIAAYSI